MNKYELVKEDCIVVDGHTLYRVRALRNMRKTIFSDPVNAGDLGGYIESEKNLSQEGTCWVFEKAIVMNNARVSGSSRIYGQSVITDNAKVSGNSLIDENVTVSGDSIVHDSKITGNSIITGNSRVFAYAKISGDVTISNTRISGKCISK